MAKRIYVALAYSRNIKRGYDDCTELSFRQANTYAARLIREGHVPFSPITHSHPLAPYLEGVSGTWNDVWATQDLSHLETCDELHVLMNDGWELSVGVNAEIRHAAKLGMPVKYIEL